MSNIKYTTREQWLEAAVAEMAPTFEKSGYEIPPVRVACGWPVRGGLGKKKRVLGECWTKDASEDKLAAQIFISPALVETNDPCGVLATLIHEVVHAVVGHKEKHNKVFGKCARAVGLEGKLTATNAGAVLLENCKTWTANLGQYPHSQLNGLKTDKKKQTTRLIKCECEECGYTVRTTQKWLESAGAPLCPVHPVAMKIIPPAEAEGDEGDEGGEE